MPSANTVAQKPAGNFNPLSSFAHAAKVRTGDAASQAITLSNLMKPPKMNYQNSQASLSDEFTVQVGVHRFAPALRSVARILYASKWNFGQCETHVVDGHHTAFDGCSDQVSGLR